MANKTYTVSSLRLLSIIINISWLLLLLLHAIASFFALFNLGMLTGLLFGLVMICHFGKQCKMIIFLGHAIFCVQVNNRKKNNNNNKQTTK